MSDPKANPYNVAPPSKPGTKKTTKQKKKMKPKKASKTSKPVKHITARADSLLKKKLRKGMTAKESTSEIQKESKTNTKKKKKKEKKKKKFDYNLPDLDKLSPKLLVTSKAPWYRAEHQVRFANSRKCSDDWSHCSLSSKHSEDDEEEGIRKDNEANFKSIKDKKSKEKYKVHPLSPTSILFLDEEIHSLCTYARLTRSEIQARYQIQEHVLNVCQMIFQKQESNTNNPYKKNCQNRTPEKEVKVTTFGSFASLEVSIFASDIDLALWNIIETDICSDKEIENKKKINKKRNATEIAKTQTYQQRHNERVQKWMDVLKKVEEEKKDEETFMKDNVKVEKSQEQQESKGILSYDLNENIVADASLFVIDDKPDKAIFSENENESKTIDSGENNGKSAKSAIEIEGSSEDNISNDSSSVEVIECSVNGGESSDEDRADKLESFVKINKVLPPPSPAASDIWPSGTDSDSCSSAEVYLGNDDDDVEVSCFVDDPESTQENDELNKFGIQHSQASSDPQRVKPLLKFGPQGKTRELVVKALTKIGKNLNKTALVQNLFVRKRARVPIINLTTRSGIDCDIALGGHNGTDTSKFAAIWIKRHNAFATVVILLKLLLRQSDLDKPFTGGLGSYKLYVLVAHHLQKHLALGGSDKPGDIFLSFLFRYGGLQTPYDGPYSKIITELKQEMIVSSDHGGMADMSSVFKIENIVKLFGLCYERLVNHYKKDKKNTRNLSYMTNIIKRKQLQTERDLSFQVSKRCQNYSNTRSVPKKGFSFKQSRKLDLKVNAKGKSKQPSKKPKRKKLKIVPSVADSSCNKDDNEAKNIMAGYGLKEGGDGKLVPIKIKN